MSFRLSAAFAALLALTPAAYAQQSEEVDCTSPNNRDSDECVAAVLPVPSLATNAAPLLALPLGLLALGGLGGGGDGTTSTTTTTSTTSTLSN